MPSRASTTEAKAAFRDAIRHAPDAATFLKHGSNFAAYLIRIGATDDLQALAQRGLAPRGCGQRSTVSMCRPWKICVQPWSKPGSSVSSPTDIPDVVVSRPTCWEVERALLVAFCELGRPQEALARISAPDFAWRDQPACRAIACFAAAAAGRNEDATRADRSLCRNGSALHIQGRENPARLALDHLAETQGKDSPGSIAATLPERKLSDPDRPKILRTLPDCGHLRRRRPAFGRGRPCRPVR